MVNIKRIISGILLVFITAISPFALSVAQESQTGNGLQITPTKTDLSLMPGEQKEFSITVKNITGADLKVESTINDFEGDGITGEPKIVANTDRQTSYSLKDKVEGLGQFDLAKGESKDVPFSISFPNDATPGGYFGVIRFTIIPNTTAGDGDESQVSLNTSIGSLLFAEVSGDITEQIQINKINICKKDLTAKTEDETKKTGMSEYCENNKSLYFSSVPNVASTFIDNKGNSFARPFGRVTLKRGNTEVYAYELNNTEPRGIVLPDSSRVFSEEIKNINTLGRYTLTVNASTGTGGEIITKEVKFWYIPIWALLVIIGIIIALIAGAVFIFVKLGKKRKSRK